MTMGVPGQPDYLAQINSTLSGAPRPGPVMLGGARQAPPPMDGSVPGAPPPNMSPMPPPGPPPMSSAATPPPMPGPGPAPAQPPQGPPDGAPRTSFLQRVHGGMSSRIPAHEVEMRGPQLVEAQQDRNVAFQGAIEAVRERGQATAAHDYALALEEQRKAGIREDAANYSAAERANELAERQAEFDQSTKALAKASVDPGRFYSSASAGTMISTLLDVTFNGFLAGKRGGPNAGLDRLHQRVEQDIKAQEFAYNATRDTANAKQSAFSMAMQKYQNVDAARAAARAASLDVAVGIANQKAALWKGTEAGNHALEAAASLSQDRANQIQAGVAFVPAKNVAVGAMYRDPRTGLTYSEAEAKGLAAKLDEREFKREEKGMDVAGQVVVEGVKAGAKVGDKEKERQGRWVPTSSTGQGYYAPTEKEAIDHREAQASTQEVVDLIDRIKKDSADLGVTGRAAAGTGLPGTNTDTVKRIEANYTQLLGATNRAQKFGALDKGATDLLKNMTGDPLSVRGNTANLDAIRSMAYEKRRELEKSSTGEKPAAMPKSFTPHGAK